MNSITQSDPGVNGSPVRHSGAPEAPAADGVSLPGQSNHSAESPFSPALREANARLLLSRAAHAAPAPAGAFEETAACLHAIQVLPTHLSWGSVNVRRACQAARLAVDQPPLRIALHTTAVTAPPATLPTLSLRAYPALLTAFLHTGQAAVGRIWLLGRHLDQTGQGWLTVATLRAELTHGAYRVCGWRRLRQLLRAGEGIFWQRDGRDRLWLYGAARLAAHLGVSRLTGRPISLPLDVVTGDIGRWRAHCYTAFHSGRVRGAAQYGAPISRATLARLTRVPARTQRHYERLTHHKRRANLAIAGPDGEAARQDHAWRHGRAHFTLIDRRGLHGPARAAYLARRLPNQYAAGHNSQATGRRRKINRWLRNQTAHSEADVHSDLVTTRERGNRCQTQSPERAPSAGQPCYCRHARAAFQHLERGATASYWPTALTTRQGGGIWRVFTAIR